MSTTCEKCEHDIATHIVHGGGADPTDWHLCDSCNPGWKPGLRCSPIVEHDEYETMPELSMIARDAQARMVAASLYPLYIEEVCDADQRIKHQHEWDCSFRDFVQAGLDDGGLYDNVFDTTGIDIVEDQHFLHLVLHFAQIGGVRV